MKPRSTYRCGGRRPAQQAGFALLGAILIAAIVVALALAIGQRSSFAIAATARVLEAGSAAQIFAALELEAQLLLRADAALGQSDAADELWAGATLTAAQPAAAGEAELRDLQGLFNLNNLVADPAAGQAAGSAPAPGAGAGTSLPQASTGSGRAAPATATNAAQGAGAPPRNTRRNASGGARPGSAANAANQRTTQSPTAAPARASANPDVLVPRDDVTLPVGIYTDKRPRGGERGPGGRAPDLPGGRGAGSGASDAQSAASSTGAEPAGGGAGGRQANPAAARQALTDIPAVAAARGPAAAVTPGAPGAAAPADRPLAPHEIALARFSLLLAALDIEAEILPAVLDWLDADTDARFPGGAEDDYYMNLDEPYRAANRPLADVTELRLVRGVTAEIYERLAPFVVVLPVTTAVNVNTAPLEVLMSLGPGIDRGTAEILAGARDVQPFQTVDAFTGFPMLVGRPLLGDGLSTRSDWFALRMQAEAGASILSARALLARSGPEQVQIVARTQGFFDVD